MHSFFAQVLAAAALCAAACDRPPESPAPPPSVGAEAEASSTPDAAFYREHVRALAADAMQGRRPGTAGGEQAVKYIVAQMQELGLEPAGEDGGWTQTVPMRSVQTDRDESRVSLIKTRCGDFEKARKKTCKTDFEEPWAFGVDWVGTTFSAGTERGLDAPLVFVGYGVTAPEYAWDDYAGVDMKGKIAVVFVGDPPLDDGRFAGPAMTYYGRWSYKFERALEAGAIGCLVIHETEPASYDWNVPTSSYTGERFHVTETDGSVPSELALEGWISAATAERLATHAGASLSKWHSQALDPKFAARPLGMRLNGRVVTSERRTEDVNVLGRIPGAKHPEQAVIVTAHWDHLGVASDAPEGEDAIYNGAVDNASGIAGLLGVGATLRARVEAGTPLARSVILLATTAEEQGLLGSRYYAAHPLVAPAAIAGVVNMDSINVHGPTRAIEVIGAGQSTMEDVLAEVAAAQGRGVVPESRPEAGGYYRSDHFPFARIGVPALYFHAALDTLEEGDRTAIVEARRANYHTVHDELDDSWSFAGSVQHVGTVTELVSRIADAEELPRWKPASEFARISR